MRRLPAALLPRILRALAAVESNHPAEPHYYLPLVGVEPEWQGRGLGTALIRPIVERHGFDVTEQLSLGPGSPPLWRMWRDPNS